MAVDLVQSMNDQIDRLRVLHAAEVRVLELRVAQLEAALAEATGQASGSRMPTASDIARARAAGDVADDAVQAWTDADSSFAEKVAVRAFFRDCPTDEAARSWLLGSS